MPIKNELNNPMDKSTAEKAKVVSFHQWVSNHRFASRKKINSSQLNFATFLTVLPLAVGFSHYILKNPSSEKKGFFFQKNLPIFRNFCPKLNFDTFEYISKSNSLANSVEKNFVSLAQENLFLFGQKNFIGKITQQRGVSKSNYLSSEKYSTESFFNPEILGPVFLSSENIENKTLSLRSVSRYLDELPAYLTALKADSANIPAKSALLLYKTEKKETQKQNESGFQPASKIELVQKKQFVSGKKENGSQIQPQFYRKNQTFNTEDNLILIKETFLNKLKLLKSKALKNSQFFDENKLEQLENFSGIKPFYNERKDFYENLDVLTSELENLYIQKNVSLLDSLLEFEDVKQTLDCNYLQNALKQNSDSLKLDGPKINFIPKNSRTVIRESLGQEEKEFELKNEDFILEKILQQFDKKIISKELSGARLMSGYNYPDMTNLELQWLYVFNQKNTFSNTSYINQLTLPSFSKNYIFDIKNLPSSLVQTKKIILQNLEKKKVLYTGPALVLDRQKAFDWKAYPEDNIRSWLDFYISSLNPLQQSRENFFGIFKSPEFQVDDKKQDVDTKRTLGNDSQQKSLFNPVFFPTQNRWDLCRDPIQSFFAPFQPSFQIPFETKDKGNPFVLGLEINPSKEGEIVSSNEKKFVPLVQIQSPTFTTYSANSENFQGYSSLFDLGVTGKVDYKFSTDVINENLFLTKSSSGRYLKIASLFSKTPYSNFVLADNWEPVTTNSWLIITQFSFAIFIFHVLKSLAENYGRELLGYLLDLVALLGFLDDSLKHEIEILMGQREKGFRIVAESKKNFTDIVGIRKLLPEIYEVVWFLRNSGRNFTLSQTLPRGILLTGPPGTGKTLLVQAIAGEAKVPVVVLSGSSLIEPGESGAVKLEMVFQEARQVAPCIVFIDEIDTLASRRSGIVQNPMGPDELLESLTGFQKSSPTIEIMGSIKKNEGISKTDDDIISTDTIQNQSQQDQLALLTQFLIELDGIQGRDGVVVIGATNRPEVLDPALLRPGRFDKILEVGLPGHQKRIEILQFYGKILGYQGDIPWNYLGDRTTGFTAADLATLMNESTIKAILNQSSHTIQTIEHGIDRLTTSSSEKEAHLKKIASLASNLNISATPQNLSVESKVAILRLAYYQAGKVVLSQFLETHPQSVVASLWPRRPTVRAMQITTNLENSMFQFARLSEITDRLVGCYAGKAAEFLFLEKFSPKISGHFGKGRGNSHMSTLGLDDLIFAQKLIYCLVEKWAFYSKKTEIQKIITLSPNINTREFREIPEKLGFYEQIIEAIEAPPMKEALETETSSLSSAKNKIRSEANSQLYYSIPWWQQEISRELEFIEKNFNNWSRLYLYNPEKSERNPEWLPPDEFYHTASGLKKLKKAFFNLSNRKKQIIENKNKKIIRSSIPSEVKIDQPNQKNQVSPSPKEILGPTKFSGQAGAEKPFLSRNKSRNLDQTDSKIIETRVSDAVGTNLKKINRKNESRYDFGPTENSRSSKDIYFSWNDLKKLTRDYPAHSLVLESFNKALVILNNNRELLDRIVVDLLYHEILRQPELELLVKDFEINGENLDQKRLKKINSVFLESTAGNQKIERTFLKNEKSFKIIEQSWGPKSRKPIPRWIDFAAFQEETT